MFKRTVTPDDLARLKAEREAADRHYNDALTEVDRALLRAPDLPRPARLPDEHQITPLNQHWQVVPADPLAGLTLWRARLASFLWRVFGPMFQGQERFNAALVDHVNRNLPIDRELRTAVADLIAVVRAQIDAFIGLQTNLIVYLQRLTPYVDTKDREVVGLMRRVNEDVAELCDLMDHRTVGLAGGLSGLGDEMLKRWESLAARQERADGRLDAVADDQRRTLDEFQARLGVLQQATLVLKREFERVTAAAAERSPAPAAGPEAGARGQPMAEGSGGTASRPQGQSAGAAHEFGAELDSYKYVGFEDQFRGSQEDIGARLTAYLPDFAGARDVLDLGCGRGEFIELLVAHGVTARGVDLNHEMVEVCRARGLAVVQGDGVAYLGSLPDGSLGGLFAAQVVEHLQPDVLVRLLELAWHKLRPGAPIVLETINPACWGAFFESYIRDVTHVRPLHPDTLQYLLQASGFQNVAIRYSAPYAERARLQPVAIPAVGADAAPAIARLADVAETFNANVDRLNGLLFSYRDYAAIGQRA